MKRFAGALLASLLLLPAAAAQANTVGAEADAWIRSDQPSQCTGTTPSLRATENLSKTLRTIVRFNAGTLTAGANTVRLNLNITTIPPGSPAPQLVVWGRFNGTDPLNWTEQDGGCPTWTSWTGQSIGGRVIGSSGPLTTLGPISIALDSLTVPTLGGKFNVEIHGPTTSAVVFDAREAGGGTPSLSFTPN